MPSFVKLNARIEYSFCNEGVRHVDGVRDRSQKNQRPQSEDRARSPCFKREHEHDEREYIGSRDRKEGRARDAYEHDNESEHAALDNASGEPFLELFIPSLIDFPRHHAGGESVDAPNNPPVVMGVHIVLAQGGDQYRTSYQGNEQSDPRMPAKPDQAHGENDIGVELGADAPARHVPG